MLKPFVIRLVNQVLQFVITLLIARQLGTEGNGYFSLFITEAAFICLIIGLSAENAIVYFLAKGKIGDREAFNIINKLLLIQLALYFVFFIFIHFCFPTFSFIYISFQNAILAFLFVIGSIVSTYAIAFFSAKNDFTTTLYPAIFLQIIFLGIFIMLPLFNKQVGFEISYQNLIIAYCILIFSIGVIAYFKLFNYVTKLAENIAALPPKYNEIFKYAAFVFIANIIQFLCYRIDFWFVDYYHGKDFLGQYAFASKIAQLWWFLPQLIAVVIFPMTAIAKFDIKKIQKLLGIVLLAEIAAGIIAVFIYPAIITLFPGYVATYSAFVLLLPGVIFFSLNIIIASYLDGEGRVKISFVSAIICFAIVLLFDILLIPKYGIEGAATASSIAYCSSTIFILFFVKQKK